MKILIIQTAFIGDVVLATPLIENLKKEFPDSEIDFLLRKGNESLLKDHPLLRSIIVFDKQKNKYKNLLKTIAIIRGCNYDLIINVQRFFTTGLLTLFSGGKERIGFRKNPLSVFYTRKLSHSIGKDSQHLHEVDRNLSLISHLVNNPERRPKLYPSKADLDFVKKDYPYICVAPSSVWFTKQYPKEKWVDLIDNIPDKYKVHLIGGPSDMELCKSIKSMSNRKDVIISAGQFNLLQSAALIKNARMTFTNDSAPLHFASAVNAPVTAIYCSTVPAFGFGPLSDESHVLETEEKLDCRPCGLHGQKACPKQHFRCSNILTQKILAEANI
jgi:heptosyltransferase-2